MPLPWKVHLENLIRTGQSGYRMYVARARFNGAQEVLFRPTIKVVEQNSFISAEEAFLDDSQIGSDDVRGILQAMSDAAWEIGIKPKQIEDNSNELKATKYHLEDMRILAKVK